MQNKIKQLRLEKRISQDYLAREVGLTQQTISRLENGKYIPSGDILINIAHYFNVSLDYLLCLKNDHEISDSDIYNTDQNIVEVYNTLNKDDKKLLINIAILLKNKKI